MLSAAGAVWSLAPLRTHKALKNRVIEVLKHR
jgi:hypothetical protein